MKKIIYLLLITLLTPFLYAKEKGELHIFCQKYVKVYVDDLYKGLKITKEDPYVVKNLEFGKPYIVELYKDGYSERFKLTLQDSVFTYESKYFSLGKELNKDELLKKLLNEYQESILKDDKSHSTLPVDSTIPLKDEFTPIDIFPEKIYNKEPEYPKSLNSDKISGLVFIKSLVDWNGNVIESEVAKSSGNDEFDTSALTASYENVYLPAVYENKRVAAWVNYKVSFTPDDDEDLPGEDEFVPVETYPEMIYEEYPEYPPLAKSAGIQGVVWIKALVDKRGEVKDAMIGKTSGSQALDDAALSVAYKNKFKPALQNSKPVAVWITYKVNFSLD